jgi:hypothetical protein
MELFFAIVIALGIGFIVGALAPGRDTFGTLAVPAASAAVTSVIWVALVWAGWGFDGTWIWVVSLVAGSLAALAVVLVLPKRRRAADEAMQQRLAKRV